ncbi:MAG: S-methyl-5'-thioadenosine phosphorylase [Myxococcota bacterium]|nr:S-methyl-5'-thioadenosine phosphorylase [Myxococcota bacterium]
MTTIGIIGGSGLYNLEELQSVREIQIETPFGATSDKLIAGTLDGVEVVFIPRHGRGHTLLPSEVPYHANIFALKTLGVRWVISASAVGSMKQEIPPGHIVIPAQYIDRTSGRRQSFFGNGIVGHVSMADPVCPILSDVLHTSVKECDIPVHHGGTYICMEGPAFSSRAESNMYRSWGVDVIGMTALPEAKLAREAELRYATLALSTDYDCWHEEEENVSVESVVTILKQNTENVQRAILKAIPKLRQLSNRPDIKSPADSALEHAIMTDPALIPKSIKRDLAPLLKKYIPVT